MILIGDMGGTNLRLALAELQEGKPKLYHQGIWPSREITTEDAFLQHLSTYLKEHLREEKLTGVSLAVAGPVGPAGVTLTNGGLALRKKKLQEAFPEIHEFHIINDLEAFALGLPLLKVEDLSLLMGPQGEIEGQAPQGLLSPGTGLGEALILQGRPSPSEGGHRDFAPGNLQEIALLLYLEKKFGHVSWERILSGPGLKTLYTFLAEKEGLPVLSLTPEEICRQGKEGSSSLASQTIDLFLSILGREASNLALSLCATGGIYLGGSLLLELLEPLTNRPHFRDGFLAKGRFQDYVKTIPVRLVLNKEAALYGAALVCPR